MPDNDILRFILVLVAIFAIVAIAGFIRDAIKAKSVLDKIMSRPKDEKITLTIERDANIMKVCEEGLDDDQDDPQSE